MSPAMVGASPWLPRWSAADGQTLLSARRRRRGIGGGRRWRLGRLLEPEPPLLASHAAQPSTHQTEQGPADWTTLSGSLTGTLLQPSDSGYAAAGHLYNAVYLPTAAAVAQCESATDVQRCLAFVRQHNLEVTAHSGGHSYGGYSTCPGLVIDVSRLNSISVGGSGSASGHTLVTIGAGTKLIDVYSDLAGQGLLLPGGSCPTVGIAGLALGVGSECSAEPTVSRATRRLG